MAKMQAKDEQTTGGQQGKDAPKSIFALEEDDEFEDFPVEGMSSRNQFYLPGLVAAV
jgi:hypothetical protein